MWLPLCVRSPFLLCDRTRTLFRPPTCPQAAQEIQGNVAPAPLFSFKEGTRIDLNQFQPFLVLLLPVFASVTEVHAKQPGAVPVVTVSDSEAGLGSWPARTFICSLPWWMQKRIVWPNCYGQQRREAEKTWGMDATADPAIAWSPCYRSYYISLLGSVSQTVCHLQS